MVNESENKCKLKLHKSNDKLKFFKENIKILRQQTEQNNEINSRNRTLLNTLGQPNVLAKKNAKERHHVDHNDKENTQFKCLIKSPRSGKNLTKNISKINKDLINYVKFRETYMQHSNYWQQIWLFTDNPIYEFENCEGFENPTYAYLNAKHNFEQEAKLAPPTSHHSLSLPTFTEKSSLYLNQTFKYRQQLLQSYLSVMNLYESILDVKSESKQATDASSLLTSASIPAMLDHNDKNQFQHFNFTSGQISSPDSSDSGIHCNSMEKLPNDEDSLYSSVMSSKKSADFLSRDFLKSEPEDMEEDSINHVEQHQLPLGWIRCCDETGTYYWHKPSGTVTRKPPISAQTNTAFNEELKTHIMPKKKFNIDEYTSLNQINELINGQSSVKLNQLTMASSSSSSNASSTYESIVKVDLNTESYYDETNELDDKLKDLSVMDRLSNPSNSSNSISSSNSALESAHNSQLSRSSSLVSHPQEVSPKVYHRFYVRSLGWVKIDENDLTPERSSKAVNKCINDLSRGLRDLNDVVSRWGEGKDLYMDLEDNYLYLIDTNDDNVLNKQSITSIRVWGVGRDNGRDFAYVARDKQTKIHMCHVFRCDSVPAKEIANTLRDTCRRIIGEKKQSKSRHDATKAFDGSQFASTFSPKSNRTDFSKFKSASCNINELGCTGEQKHHFMSSMDEPKKSISCKYLGSSSVSKPSGMVTLNEAIERIYLNALDEYKRKKKQNKLKNKNLFKLRRENSSDKEIKNSDDDEDDDDDDDDEEELDYRENAFSFDLLDLNREKKLGIDVNIIVSPSTVTVRKLSANMKQLVDEDLIFECRVRYLSFMGISNDVRLCGFIVHCIDNTFKCHAFLCENSSSILCKTIEAACKLRYQKCLDAHPEAAESLNANKNKQSVRFGYLGTQLKGMFDSLKNRNIFSSYNLSTASQK